MKPAIIRSIDAQGRIILPAEIRRTMGLYEGDILEIQPSGQGIYLSKYKSGSAGDQYLKKYLNLLYSVTGCSVAICSCDEIIASRGIFLRNGTPVGSELSEIICRGEETRVKEDMPFLNSGHLLVDTVFPLTSLLLEPCALILFKNGKNGITDQERICARMIARLMNTSE